MDKTRFRLLRFCEVLTLISGWLLLGAAVLITVEVFGRKFFSFSLQGADEVAGYALALSATAGFSYALVQRRHIRVDLLVRRFALPARAAIHLAAYLTITGFAALLCARAWSVFAESWEFQSRSVTPLRTPLTLPQGLWLMASAVFLAVAIILTVRLVRLMLRRDWTTASRDYAITDDLAAMNDDGDGAGR